MSRANGAVLFGVSSPTGGGEEEQRFSGVIGPYEVPASWVGVLDFEPIDKRWQLSPS